MNVLTPSSLSEAMRLRADISGAMLLAGGTDAVANWSGGAQKPETLIVLPRQAGLARIVRIKDGVKIGALATPATIIFSSFLRSRYPALTAGAASIGSPAIRNMATLGGNLANASPAADLPPALLIYDAELELRSIGGVRRVSIADFFLGYKKTALRPNEIITGVFLPAPPVRARSAFYKVGTRKVQAISKVSLAGLIVIEKHIFSMVRFAAGSIAPTPVRLGDLEVALVGRRLTQKTIETIVGAIPKFVRPIDDVRSTAAYRLTVLQNLLMRFLRSVSLE